MEGKTKKSKAILIAIIAVIILAIIFFFVFKNRSNLMGTKDIADNNKVFQSLFGTSTSKNLEVVDTLNSGNNVVQVNGEAGEDIKKGDLVYKAGYNSNGDPIIKKIKSNNPKTSEIYGVALEDINSGDMGSILIPDFTQNTGLWDRVTNGFGNLITNIGDWLDNLFGGNDGDTGNGENGSQVIFPTVTVTASPAFVQPGESSTISWISSDTTSCKASGTNISSTSGSFNTGALTRNEIYTVICTDSNGSSIGGNAFVYVGNSSSLDNANIVYECRKDGNAVSCNAIPNESNTLTYECKKDGAVIDCATVPVNPNTGTYKCTGGGVSVDCGLARIINPVYECKKDGAVIDCNPSQSNPNVIIPPYKYECRKDGAIIDCATVPVNPNTDTYKCIGGGVSVDCGLVPIRPGISGYNCKKDTTAIICTVPPYTNEFTFPTVSVKATPSTIKSGESSDIEWTSTNATLGCRASNGNGGAGTTGTFNTGSLTKSKSYTVTCTGANGTAVGNVFVHVGTVGSVDSTKFPTVTITANPAFVKPGESSTISWISSSDVTSCKVSGNSNPDTSGSFNTGALAESKEFAITCVGSNGSSVGSNAFVYVGTNVDPKLFPTVSIKATPSLIKSGESSDIEWTSTNATLGCRASDGNSGTRATGTFNTGPLTKSKSYTVTCVGDNGSITGNTFVYVETNNSNPDMVCKDEDGRVIDCSNISDVDVCIQGNVTVTCPWGGEGEIQIPTVNVTATPSSVDKNGSSIIKWVASDNAVSCDAGAGNGTGKTGEFSTGPLTTTKSYTIVCTGANGSTGADTTFVTIKGGRFNFPSVSAKATPSSVDKNGSSVISWTSSSNSISCTRDGGLLCTKNGVKIDCKNFDKLDTTSTYVCKKDGVTADCNTIRKVGLNDNFNTGPLAKTTSYRITCESEDGSTGADTAFVMVNGGDFDFPTVSVTATPSTVDKNGSSVISWTSSSNAKSCSRTGNGGFVCTKNGANINCNNYDKLDTTSTYECKKDGAVIDCNNVETEKDIELNGSFNTGPLTKATSYIITCESASGGAGGGTAFVMVNWSGFNQCGDGVNNDPDQDTLIDRADPGCYKNFDTAKPDDYDASYFESRQQYVPQCQDIIDNDEIIGVFKDGADIDDPQCHTDGDKNNANSYDKNIRFETGSIHPIDNVCTNGAINYDKCDVLPNGQCMNGASNPTITSVGIFSSITDFGNPTATSRGLCWAPLENQDALTLANAASGTSSVKCFEIPAGVTIGAFSTTAIGLLPDTEYKTVSYAKTSAGVTYSDQLTFSTNENASTTNAGATPPQGAPVLTTPFVKKPDTCNIFNTCKNGTTNYPECTVLPNGKCLNNATNPPECDSSDTTLPNICLNIEQNPLTYTDAEKARLAILLRKFYLISSTLRTDADIATIYNEINQQKNFISQTSELTKQCYLQTNDTTGYADFCLRNKGLCNSADDKFETTYASIGNRKHGNPWYSKSSNGSYPYSPVDQGYTEGDWLSKNNVWYTAQYTPDEWANITKDSSGCEVVSGYYYGTLTKITKNDTTGVTYNPGDSCYDNFNTFPGYGVCSSQTTDGYLFGNYSAPSSTLLQSGCKWKWGVDIGQTEKLLNIW